MITTAIKLRHRPILVPVVYAFGALMLLVLYSSANRPIWYDEMVTFTIGGLPDLRTTLEQIYATTTNLNQGTTGVYLLSEYLSLSLFGAHWWSMRLPSLLTAVWALAALYVFLKTKGVHPVLIVLTPLLALGYPTLWYFAGEARTYMPLVAGVLGTLAYYSLDEARRESTLGRLLGWGSVFIGVLFHPYFLLYWPVIVVFTQWEFVWAKREALRLRGLWQHSNPTLTVTAGAAGAALALTTWLRGNIEQPVQWDEWLGSPLPKEVLTALFWPFFDSGWFGVVAAAILAPLILMAHSNSRAVSPMPPMVLIGVSLVLSLVVTAASIAADFWVFPRQWIASQALVLAALPWLANTILRSRRPASAVRVTALSLTGVLLLPSIVSTGLWKASQLREWAASSSRYGQLNESGLAAILDSGAFPGNRTWMEFSQANLSQGGKVWPSLGRYYTDKDWSAITLQKPARQELFLEEVGP